MRWWKLLRLGAQEIARPAAVDRDLTDEIEGHLELLTEEYVAAGLSYSVARARALRDFGGPTQVAEECRDSRIGRWFAAGLQDLAHGVRLLRRYRGFALSTILTVALGVGATTAMFSVVYGVVIRPLPFGNPEGLITLKTSAPRRGLPAVWAGAIASPSLTAGARAIEGVALVQPVATFILAGVGEPERLAGARVQASLFSILQVSPLLGRTFTPHEREAGSDRAVLLSYQLWRDRFDSDPAIVGRAVSLNEAPHVVVGVMRPDFRYPSRSTALWTPLTIDAEDFLRRAYGFTAIGRLAPGATLDEGQADAERLVGRLGERHPELDDGAGVTVALMLDSTVEAVRRSLYGLMAGVGAMLLIACANLANLLAARTLARRRELAVRAALGASSGRLLRQSIAELVPPLAVGGSFGIVLAAVLLRALLPAMPSQIPRVEEIGIHWPVVAFTLATLVAMAVATAAWSAVTVGRVGPSAVMDGPRLRTPRWSGASARDVLVVGQIAATLVLLAATSLLMHNLLTLRTIDPGFDTDSVLAAEVVMPRGKYPEDRDVAAFGHRVVKRIRGLPGVASAGMTSRLPLAGGAQLSRVAFEADDSAGSVTWTVDGRSVTPGYFETLRIPLLEGRLFTEADDEAAPLVGIVDERLAEAFWPGSTTVGRRFRLAIPGQPWATIVGVVTHVQQERLGAIGRPQVYWSDRQRTRDRMALLVRVDGDPAAQAPAIAEAIRTADPDQPSYHVRTLEAVAVGTLSGRRMQAVLFGSFASLALLLACVGVYGVTAYTVRQRLSEFGVRLALGATRGGLVSLTLRRGLALLAAGVAAGGVLGVAAAVSFDLTLLLDTPGVIGSALSVLVLGAAMLVACYLPARRAASVDPSVVLRAD